MINVILRSRVVCALLLCTCPSSKSYHAGNHVHHFGTCPAGTVLGAILILIRMLHHIKWTKDSAAGPTSARHANSFSLSACSAACAGHFPWALGNAALLG